MPDLRKLGNKYNRELTHLNLILRAQLLEVLKGHDLSHDEALLKVSMDPASCPGSLSAFLGGGTMVEDDRFIQMI